MRTGLSLTVLFRLTVLHCQPGCSLSHLTRGHVMLSNSLGSHHEFCSLHTAHVDLCRWLWSQMPCEGGSASSRSQLLTLTPGRQPD